MIRKKTRKENLVEFKEETNKSIGVEKGLEGI